MPLVAPPSGPVDAPTPPVTLTEATAWCLSGTTAVPQDGRLQRVLDAATAHVEEHCGPVLPTLMRYLVEPTDSGALLLPCGPISEVVALVNPDGRAHTDTELEALAGAVDWASGIIHRPGGTGLTGWHHGPWQVTVRTARDTAGQQTLRLAILVICRHLWNVEAGFGQRAIVDAVPAGYAVPRRATELMAPYTLVSVA